MITSVQITIDLNSAYTQKIKLPQNELGGRTLYFTLTSSGVMVDLTDRIVVLSGEKPDGTVLFLPCVVTNATYGMVKCAITDQFVSAVGEIALQIRIYNSAMSGTATSATSLSLYDTTQAFTPNLYAGKWIYIVSGSGSGQSRLIASNTATQIVVTEAWSVNPSAGSIYSVVSEVGNSFPFFATVVKSVDIDTQVESSSDFSALQTAISAAAGLDAAALHKTGDETITGYKSVLSPTSADHIANKAYVDRYSPVGEIKIWPTASAPVGFLLCNGTLISRTTYAALFAVIGTSYGAGNGSTTFALPNLLGKVVAGKTASGTFSTLGAAVGSETVSLTESQNGPHFHGFSNNFLDGAQMNGTPNRQVACAGGGSTPGGAVTSTAGAGSAHNNIQPTVVMNYIIRALA